MKQLFILSLAALAFAGCATAPEAAPKKDLTEPEMVQLTDPNPYANYGAAMASTKGMPMAYEWQKANDAAIEKALAPDVLRGFVESDEAAASLLAQVKEAYASDPVVLAQIAAVSQKVMCPTCPEAPKQRARWTAALMKAAKSAPDAYRALFYLDQLRWCGYAGEADDVRAIGEKSGEKSVKDFAALVARELKAAK